MARDHHAPDARLDLGERRGRLVQDVDFHQALAVEHVERPSHGDEDGVVKVEAENLALRFHDADDAVALAADPQARAERVVAAEQLLRHPGAEHREGARRARVVVRQELAARRAHAERAREVRAGAVERDAPALAGVLDLGVALHQRIGHLHVAHPGEREGVVDRQRAHRVHGAERGAVRRDAPGRHGHQVGAELGELGDHEAVQSLADGGEQDHRRDADRDAERGERGAQPVRAERGEGESGEIGGTHRAPYRFESACTGSSFAARRAGATENRIEVAIAVSGAASTAPHGAVNGMFG